MWYPIFVWESRLELVAFYNIIYYRFPHKTISIFLFVHIRKGGRGRRGVKKGGREEGRKEKGKGWKRRGKGGLISRRCALLDPERNWVSAQGVIFQLTLLLVTMNVFSSTGGLLLRIGITHHVMWGITHLVSPLGCLFVLVILVKVPGALNIHHVQRSFPSYVSFVQYVQTLAGNQTRILPLTFYF